MAVLSGSGKGNSIGVILWVILVLLCFWSLEVTALERDESMAASRAAIGKIVGNVSFTTSAGDTVQLADFRGKPTLVSLIFTSCFHICPTQTSTLWSATRAATDLLGADQFNVLTIGFDTRNDTPSRMGEYARERGIDAANWHFLAADEKVIEQLSADVGFLFEPTAGGFDHLLQTTVLNSDGAVAYQVYGSAFDPPTLIEPLRDLLIGSSVQDVSFDGWVETIKLFCTVFDPASGRYKFDYSIFVALFAGLTCLGGVAYFLIGLWRSPTA